MSDDADIANDRRDEELARAIEARRLEGAKKPPVLVSTGECANECGSPVAAGSRFCGPECCHDFDQRAAIARKQRA